MRGLDPRIHAFAIVASACIDDVDGRIKSGHDVFEDGLALSRERRVLCSSVTRD
jgi:hypothetical protein